MEWLKWNKIVLCKLLRFPNPDGPLLQTHMSASNPHVSLNTLRLCSLAMSTLNDQHCSMLLRACEQTIRIVRPRGGDRGNELSAGLAFLFSVERSLPLAELKIAVSYLGLSSRPCVGSEALKQELVPSTKQEKLQGLQGLSSTSLHQPASERLAKNITLRPRPGQTRSARWYRMTTMFDSNWICSC